MVIDNYEQFQKKLIEVVQPSILSGLKSEREEFREIIKNTLFDLYGPRYFASSLTRRDEVFASQLFLDFNEIVASYLSLKDIEIYINRFPYRDTGVSALRYLKYHIESHLNEIYIFKERFEAYLTFVERRYRKSPISENVSSTAQGLKKIILSSLDGIITIRGAHVHSKRFSDQDLDRLTFLEMFREIDMTYEEVNSVASNIEQETENTSPMQRVLKEQEEKDRAKRKQQYAQILPSHLIDIEIQPFESPRDNALLTVRSVTGCFLEVVEIEECFAFIEFLMDHNFVTLSSGKIRRDKDPRENEDRVFTWFIFSKPNEGQA